MIEIAHLKKQWDSDSVVLNDINLKIRDGEIFALVGRSGAGKSTLLRCINGLTSYQSGSLKVNNQEVREMTDIQLREFRRDIGMIFQQFSLLERENVFNNVALPMRCWKYTKEEINQKVTGLLKLVGLEDKANARPRNLSGGQKQRVAIARALTMNPSILLCDEATSALDPNTTTAILDLLKKINEEMGITIIIVTHQMEVVRQVCSRACILEHGEVSSIGSVKDLFMNQPKALLRLLGDENQHLPSEGINVRIAQTINSREQGEVFASMYSELGFVFSIVGGTIQSYENDRIGIFTLNIPEDRWSQMMEYLNDNGIAWVQVEEMKEEVQG